jgi:hypothetical protein
MRLPGDPDDIAWDEGERNVRQMIIMNAAASHALWRACLHEYAHLVVARHFGAAGFVAIVGDPASCCYGGRFQMHGELADDEWRIVALAGVVAERLDEEPTVTATVLAAALRANPRVLGGTDAQLATGCDEADVERCLGLVRKLWRDIAGEANERFAGETATLQSFGPLTPP